MTTATREQIPLWDGITLNGNLSHRAIRLAENVIAEADACVDGIKILKNAVREMAQIIQVQAERIDELEKRLRRTHLAALDLRYLNKPCSSREMDRRAQDYDEHVCYAGTECQRWTYP